MSIFNLFLLLDLFPFQRELKNQSHLSRPGQFSGPLSEMILSYLSTTKIYNILTPLLIFPFSWKTKQSKKIVSSPSHTSPNSPASILCLPSCCQWRGGSCSHLKTTSLCTGPMTPVLGKAFTWQLSCFPLHHNFSLCTELFLLISNPVVTSSILKTENKTLLDITYPNWQLPHFYALLSSQSLQEFFLLTVFISHSAIPY